jgi:hypothetical protein
VVEAKIETVVVRLTRLDNAEPSCMKYPAEAHASSGELWWDLKIWPGKKRQRFGDEPKLASWLKFDTVVGEVFTIRRLRQALGSATGANTNEHFNRRLRNLRKYKWIVLSGRDAADLKQNEYRLERVGAPIWLGKSKHGKKGVSDKTRRGVFQRDGHRCLLCGIGAGEPYPDQPNRRARLTLGHFIADSLSGPNDPVNLRTECSRCNEPVKEEAQRSESGSELWPKIRSLRRIDKKRLLRWIGNGYRERDAVDRLFDDVRTLPAPQRKKIQTLLERAVRNT